jgi:hypothetical protein
MSYHKENGEVGEKQTMKLARVFPRRNRATPDDALAFFGLPPFSVECDEVHVDVTFTADKFRAEHLAEQWRRIAPVKVGGVAYGDPGQEFIAGRYVKHGYTFTSRGCPERCWYCSVWKRDPQVRILPIQDGWNVLDDNLLACPEEHFKAVITMLSRQKRRVEFTGGLQASRLMDWHVEGFSSLKPRPVCFFAYDDPDKCKKSPLDAMRAAATKMLTAGFTAASHRLRTFVFVGFPQDTFEKAESRLRDMVAIGFTPYAMLWQPETPSAERYRPAPDWKRFQRSWARPAIIYGSCEPDTDQEVLQF